MNNQPKISIITVSYNSAETIKDSIESVLAQNYSNIEYIIIDAGSKDNTIEIVDSYHDKINYFISERDEGIYDGMNKGISAATGDFIGILNSDDFYPSNDIVSKVAKTIIKYKCDSVYGDLIYVRSNKIKKVVRYWQSGEFSISKLKKGWMLPHPTFFVRRKLYKKYGMYNTELKSAADYEMILRLLYKHNISVRYIPEILVNMRQGGKSNSSLLNRLKANHEDSIAWKINDLAQPYFIRLKKPIIKIRQFFVRPKSNIISIK